MNGLLARVKAGAGLLAAVAVLATLLPFMTGGPQSGSDHTYKRPATSPSTGPEQVEVEVSWEERQVWHEPNVLLIRWRYGIDNPWWDEPDPWIKSALIDAGGRIIRVWGMILSEAYDGRQVDLLVTYKVYDAHFKCVIVVGSERYTVDGKGGCAAKLLGSV